MKGVILAAGKGARLNGLTGNTPKCLLRIGGPTLIERHIDTLRAAGIDDVVLVVGCQADHVRRICGPHVTYVENTRFAQTNSLYSLWLARTLLREGFVVMNCDVLFHPQLLSDLLTARHEDALLIGYDPGPLGEEEMKVHVSENGRLDRINKALDPATAQGEYIGVALIGPAAAAPLADALEATWRRDPSLYYEDGFQELVARGETVHTAAIGEVDWVEVDDDADLARAREIAWRY